MHDAPVVGRGGYTLIAFVGVIGKNNGENASHWCPPSLCMHAMMHHVCKKEINEALMAHMRNGVQVWLHCTHYAMHVNLNAHHQQ